MPFLDAIVETSSADHSIVIDDATAGKTVVVAVSVAAAITLHADSVAAGWVQDLYGVNNLGAGIYRLDGADNPGGDLTLRLTHNGPRALAGVAIEDNITGLAYTPMDFEEDTQGTGGTFTTQAATRDSTDLVLCVFAAITTAAASAVDVTGFNNGFTELGDSGWSAGGGDESARLWMAYDEDVALSATVVTATLNSSAASWRIARTFIGYTLSAASEITGTAAATLGATTATAAGQRGVNGAAAATPGALGATATGTRGVGGTGLAALGAAAGSAVSFRNITGTALAALGGLSATSTGTGVLAIRGTISGISRTTALP